MKKAVLDTNILVSATFWNGNPYKITQKAIENKIQCYISKEILDEYSNTLRRDFKLNEEQIEHRLEKILLFVILVNPKTRIDAVTDKDDNKILEVAIEAKAKYIISGDHHLLELKEFKGIKIVKAKEFLEEIEK